MGSVETYLMLLSVCSSPQGVAKLSALVSKYTDQPSSYSPTELRKTLDDFREVLFKHMDDEVCYFPAIFGVAEAVGFVGRGLEGR